MTDSNDSEPLSSANFDEVVSKTNSSFIYDMNGQYVTLEDGPQNIPGLKLNSSILKQKPIVSHTQQITQNVQTAAKNVPSILRRSNPLLSPKLNQGLPIRNSLPTNVDSKKLMEIMDSDTDEDDEEEVDDTNQILRDMRSELMYTETKINQVKNERSSLVNKIKLCKNPEKALQEKEWEARLEILADKRRQQHNIYKLKFLEMEARVRLAEAELQRSEDLHKLKRERIKLLIDREQEDCVSEIAEN